jgi:hypothetical protein
VSKFVLSEHVDAESRAGDASRTRYAAAPQGELGRHIRRKR